MAATKKKTASKSKPVSNLWNVIERVRKRGKGDLDDSIEAFEHELSVLDDASLIALEASFVEQMARANTWDLWAAAYAIHGVISDDMFWDVRAGLVALGQQVFEAALSNPDSLASVKDVVGCTLFEGFQYVPADALDARGLTSKAKRTSSKLLGKKWNTKALEHGDTRELERRFPRLTRRFAKGTGGSAGRIL
jgi:hypothetical protein